MPYAFARSSPNLAAEAGMRRLASARATSCQATSGWPFFGLCFFQTCACSSRVAAAIVRSCSSFGMLPSAITSSIAGCRCASSFRRRDGAYRQGERIADGLFVPALGFEPLDRAPDVHARHRGANQVLGDCAHRGYDLIGVTYKDLDRRQFGLDRGLHPAIADLDRQTVVRHGHARRLDDADGLDRGEQLLVHRRRHRCTAGIVRVGLEGAGIDAAKFGHGGLLWVGISSSLYFGKTPPTRRVPDGGARARTARGHRRVPCGGGRRCGSHLLVFFPVPIPALFISPWSFPLIAWF